MYNESFPTWRGQMEYVCLNCQTRFPGDQLLYTCPACGGVFLLEDTKFNELARTSPKQWRDTFDARRGGKLLQLQGVFLFYELVAPVFDQQDIIYLGEGQTPVVPFARRLRDKMGADCAFKNEGQNPSASFKDRGMACAFSCLNWLCRIYKWDEVLTICASTGDTSAAAALYASYIGSPIKSVVILPKGKVTPQQLSQPLGHGATVIEIPGVFDDCMKVVENLAENYNVALLNSKNSWRILGQQSYAYEVAQWLDWDLANASLFVPIGNAGNITAILGGLLKMHELGIIKALPRVFGAQSSHADPVFRYYEAPESERVWSPVQVRPSVAQAAMIGNPVSFPRLAYLAKRYLSEAGKEAFQVIRVSEQEIMDAMLTANRNGHISCTQGGECFAAAKIASEKGLLRPNERVILDSTAHALKFMDFQNKYFADSLPPEYEVEPRAELQNAPCELLSDNEKDRYSQKDYARLAAETIAEKLNLKRAAK